MRILHLLPSLNLYGGTPSKIRQLIRHSKHNHTIYCWDRWEGQELYKTFKKEFMKDNVRIYEGFYGKNIYNHMRRIMTIVNYNSIEIIHAYFSFGELLGYLTKLLRPSIKVIISFVGAESPSNILKLYLLKTIYSQFDFFIYISNYVKTSKQNTFNILINKKGSIIYNGADISYIKENNSANSINYNNTIITTIGGLNKYKNIPILIDIMSILINNYKRNIVLNIIGDGPQKNLIVNKISKYNLEHCINLLGYQSNITKFLQNTNIYIHPSNREGFGISVIEAMLMKKPVILSNAGALPELVVNNESGLLCDPYNPYDWVQKIISLLDNPKLSKTMSYKGYERACELFSIKRFVDDHDKIYKDLITR
jgi:glycosyltransferase involved in cell wall biosynthesis